MKTSNYLNVVLAAAVVILSVKIALRGGSDTDAAAISSEAAVMDNIMTRTSVRSYLDTPVESEKVERMLRAAMAAPTAGNKQPWRFVVIEDRQTLETISEHFNTMKMAAKAPLAIVVCGDMNDTFPGDGLDYWVEDASAATENLLLAAHAMGLGAVWCGIYPMQERVTYLRELLQLPDNIVPLNVIPIGYPAEEPAPKDKWRAGNIHRETWADGTTSDSAAAESAPAPASVAGKDSPAAGAWKKIDPEDLTDNPFVLFNKAMALSVGNSDKMNAMTIGWGGLGVLWGRERPVVTVYVEKSRYTHSLMEENDYFIVEAFDPAFDGVLKYLGTVSGRDEDKMKGSGLTVGFTDLGNPIFEEGRLVLECEKLYGAPFDPQGFGRVAQEIYRDRQLHSIYIGRIVNAWIKQ